METIMSKKKKCLKSLYESYCKWVVCA